MGRSGQDPRALAQALVEALGAEAAGTEQRFAELALPWVEKRWATHRSARHDVGRMRGHLIPFFGQERVSSITELMKLCVADS